MNRYLKASIWAVAMILIDQATKLWVSSSMEVWTGKVIIPGLFNLVHVLNRGAAWGFLNSESISWQRPLFIVITFIALGFIVYMLKTAEKDDNWLITGLGLIAGGAVGNLIDRIHKGSVTDFLDFYVGEYHWPAFNVADCALTLGAGCIILSLIINRHRDTRV